QFCAVYLCGAPASFAKSSADLFAPGPGRAGRAADFRIDDIAFVHFDEFDQVPVCLGEILDDHINRSRVNDLARYLVRDLPALVVLARQFGLTRSRLSIFLLFPPLRAHTLAATATQTGSGKGQENGQQVNACFHGQLPWFDRKFTKAMSTIL